MKTVYITITKIDSDDTYTVACTVDLSTFMFTVYLDENVDADAIIYEAQAIDGMDCQPYWTDPMLTFSAKQQIDNFILGIQTALNF